MNLSELQFRINYNSYEQDIIRDFYVPALSNALHYDRVSAFFDSKILALYSSGIEALYAHQGRIRFIFSQKVSPKDYDLMCEGYSKRAEAILMENLKVQPLNEVERERLSNLAFLIEKGLVDIKIAFTKEGILHDKYGLIYDDMYCIYFRGSNNETVAAIEQNHESFEVSCSWNHEPLENKKIQQAKLNFERMWNNQEPRMMVLPIPDVVKEHLLSYSKNRLYMEGKEYPQNALIANLDDTNNLILINSLTDYDLLVDYDYTRFIKRHVTQITGNRLHFSTKSNYVLIKDILGYCEKSAAYNKYNFIVSENLKDFIDKKDIEIEKLRKLGTYIKGKNTLPPEDAKALFQKFDTFAEIVRREMQRVLYPQQMWDSFFITKMKKSANFSVPGAGKTSIVYGAFAYLNRLEERQVNKIVMVGPLNSFKAWKDEFKKCFGTKKNAKVLNIQDFSSKQQIHSLRLNSELYNLILINYEKLQSLQEVLNEIIDDKTMLVFDEVHKIKAVTGVRATAAKGICHNNKYTVILTGTPLPNSYVDLYNPLHLLFPDEYDAFFSYSPTVLKNADTKKAIQINRNIYPFFCRTTKKQLEVPAPNEDIRIVSSMTPEEKNLFSLIHHQYSHHPLTLYIRLLQASTNPHLLLNHLSQEDVYQFFDSEASDDEEEKIDIHNKGLVIDDSPVREPEFIKSLNMTSKFWQGIKLVQQLVSEGKQVIVWGIFTQTLEKIVKELTKREIKTHLIYGATPLQQREKMVDLFKNKEFPVLVTNPHTLAESVSLHETCHDAVYFEYSFNLTHMLQSRDRIHRVGLPQEQYTQYYYLFLSNPDSLEDSIDEKTYNRLKDKEKKMLATIEGQKLAPILFDSKEDLEYILSKK